MSQEWPRPYAYPFEIHDNYVQRSVLDFTDWHWHPSIQFCLMLDGSAVFYVNHNRVELMPGEAIFINSQQIHKTYNESSIESHYLTFDLQPETLYGYSGIDINPRFITPYIRHDSIDHCHITGNAGWEKEVLHSLDKVSELYPEVENEFEVHLQLQMIWLTLYHNLLSQSADPSHYINEHMRRIIGYIEEHYAEPVELEDIADAAGLARTYCCREFKKQMNCTVFQYLNNYRLARSIEHLKNGESVTEAALSCGFNTSSYYIKKFRETMGTTPYQYLR